MKGTCKMGWFKGNGENMHGYGKDTTVIHNSNEKDSKQVKEGLF